MLGDRADWTAQIAAVEAIVRASGDLFIEISAHNAAERVLVVGDALRPLVASHVFQSVEFSAFELCGEIVVVRVAPVFARIYAVPVRKRARGAWQIRKTSGVRPNLVEI